MSRPRCATVVIGKGKEGEEAKPRRKERMMRIDNLRSTLGHNQALLYRHNGRTWIALKVGTKKVRWLSARTPLGWGRLIAAWQDGKF